MKLTEKIGLIIVGAFLVGMFGLLVRLESPSPSLGSGSLYIPAYIATSSANQATTTLYAFSGVLHSITVATPVSNSVINVYDSATTTSPTALIAQITIPSSTAISPFTLLVDGVLKNGLTISQSVATSTVTLTFQQQ